MNKWPRVLAAVLLVLLFATCTSTSGSDQPQTCIVFIGDSITQGSTARGNDGGYTYRYWFWRMLVDADAEFDFVGSENTGYATGNPERPDHLGREFDPDHEGHWGWSTEYVRMNLERWLEAYDADVAVIHLGHNDRWAGVSNETIGYESTDDNLRAIVKYLRRDNRRITIVLARVIPAPADSRDFPPEHIHAVNAVVEGIAADADTPNSRVYLVNMHTGFNAEEWTYDYVHPNALGEKFMAQRLFETFVQYQILPFR